MKAIIKRWVKLIVCLTVPLLMWVYWEETTPTAGAGLDQHGQRGDAFGSLNVLFSGMAFAVLFCALLFQREELELQREELQLTREEITKSGAAQNDSARALQVQAQMLQASSRLNALIYHLSRLNDEIEEMGRRLDNCGDEEEEGSLQAHYSDLLDERREVSGAMRRQLREITGVG